MIKLETITPIHHYSGKLLIGDASEIVTKIKENLDKDDPFLDWDSMDFFYEIEKIKKFDSSKYYCMPHSGGGFHQLFYTSDNQDITGFFIDTASSEFRIEPWLPRKFYSKKHNDELFHNIKKSIETSKPIAEFECPSKKILLCQAGGEIIFYNENDQVSIDYKNKSTNDIILELEEYSDDPKVKFSNFMSNVKDYTFDFWIDDIFESKFQIYEIIFQNKKIENFADYYATYYADEKKLNKKKYLNEKEKEKMKKWTEDQLGGLGMPDNILGKDHLDRGTAPIEEYKSYVDDNGFLMGYYFKVV